MNRQYDEEQLLIQYEAYMALKKPATKMTEYEYEPQKKNRKRGNPHAGDRKY